MFALALVNVDSDPFGGAPPTPPPRRHAYRPTSTADSTHSTRPDPIDVDQCMHKTATRQRWHWSTSIQGPPRAASPRNRKTTVAVPAVLEAGKPLTSHTQHNFEAGPGVVGPPCIDVDQC